MLVDYELHARQPDPVIGQHRDVIGKLGITEIRHDGRARTGQCARCDSGYLVWQFAVIHLADFAIGTADRYHSPRRELLDRAGRANHRRHAQFAREKKRRLDLSFGPQ